MSDEYDDSVQSLAEQLAARGQDALVEQLRLSFQQAAAAHADIVRFDGDRLEAVVQSFVPRADGLQWRRALAAVASEQLGIELTEALNHPAVARAQEIVGAPSYEESLAELVSRTSSPGTAVGGPGESDDVWEADAVPAAAPDQRSEAAGPSWLDAAAADGAQGDAGDGSYGTEAAPEAAGAHPVGSEPDVFGPEPNIFGPGHDASETEPGPDDSEPAHDDSEPARDDSESTPAAEREATPYGTEVAPYVTETTAFSSESEPNAPAAGAADTAAEELDEPAGAYSRLAATTDPQTYAASEAQATEVATAEELPASNYSAGSRLPEPSAADPPPAAATATAVEQLRVAAIHLGGVANLTTHRQPVDLRLWEPGLDIVRSDDEIIGRLGWEDIEALEVPAPRGLLRRRTPSHAQLVVRTESGDASFEIPELTPEELRARVQTLIDRFGRR